MTAANLIKLFLNSDCAKPVDESNAHIAEGGAFCGEAENEVLAKTNSGAAKLATVQAAGGEDNTRDWSESDTTSSTETEFKNEIGRRRILAQ